MNTMSAIEVIRACAPMYQRLVQVPKYKPTPEEQEQLKKFSTLYKLGAFDDAALLSATDFEICAFLIGYISSQD
jgi:hypothetical protein